MCKKMYLSKAFQSGFEAFQLECNYTVKNWVKIKSHSSVQNALQSLAEAHTVKLVAVPLR